MPSSIFSDDNSGFLRKPSAITTGSLTWPIRSERPTNVEALPDTGNLVPKSGQMFNESGEQHAMACADASFDDVCERYYNPLYCFVVLHIGDAHYAEEIVQDTLIAASRHWSELRCAHEKQLLKWLYVTADRKTKDHLRHEKRRVPHWSSYQQIIAPESYVSDNDVETNEVLRQALGQLPQRERECMLYVFHCGYSIEEVAHGLHIGASSVRSYLTRGRKRFRQIYTTLQKEFTDGRSKK